LIHSQNLDQLPPQLVLSRSYQGPRICSPSPAVLKGDFARLSLDVLLEFILVIPLSLVFSTPYVLFLESSIFFSKVPYLEYIPDLCKCLPALWSCYPPLLVRSSLPFDENPHLRSFPFPIARCQLSSALQPSIDGPRLLPLVCFLLRQCKDLSEIG